MQVLKWVVEIVGHFVNENHASHLSTYATGHLQLREIQTEINIPPFRFSKANTK